MRIARGCRPSSTSLTGRLRWVNVSLMRTPGGTRLGVIGVTAASLLAASCINFAPAVSSQASTVEAARSIDVGFADVTGDGADDVIVAVSLPGADALVRMAPCGGGCLERREEVLPGDEVWDLATADFDGDGVMDVAVVTAADVKVYFGGTATAGRPEGLVADDVVVAALPELQPWSRVVAATHAAWSTGEPREALANAVPYMQAFGHGVLAWIWLDVAVAALDDDPLAKRPASAGVLGATGYFYRYELPKINAWLRVVETRDMTCANLPEEAF